MKRASFAVALIAAAFARSAIAGPTDTLRDFVRDVKSGRAEFTQSVIAADGTKKKPSTGSFEFQRPNHFRFIYARPFEQTIVADGDKVWIYDKDLNQASSRRITQALGATPAALLAGGSIERDFALADLPSQGGLDWVEARPKAKDSAFQSVRIGFRSGQLAALEIRDSFGQTSLLQFTSFVPNAQVPAADFVFKVPAGADVIEQ